RQMCIRDRPPRSTLALSSAASDVYKRQDPRGVATRTIDMHVMRLREKLRDDTAAPRRLLTVRGQGYAWAATEPGR
ncbi:MAG: helix-turn-helix domain-containing protein, partial [bacterium]